MKRRLAGLGVVVLSLALSTGRTGASSKELQIIDTSIEGSSVVVKIENTTDALVDGRCLGFFNDGNSTHADEEVFVNIQPGVHEIRLEFPSSGPVAPSYIVDSPEPTGQNVLPGEVLLGTITDDTNPF